ncbi:cysteine peptidase family C39 domain-containing protein [Runella sp. SP2]|uniref:cysteine peptidase family C39 domain-containing protein n=1 Tax=Runella sp. SP2 TaxID=2268026 RepID=UPI000F09586D|nr:hypothetical protein DTQ70_18850 [Runella sp. SP2]
MDCGHTCLRVVVKYYGQHYSAQSYGNVPKSVKYGVNLLGISEAAKSIDFCNIAVKVSLDKLLQEASLPCIVLWSQNHFIIQSHCPRCVALAYHSSRRGLIS